ncbi:MAG: redoxin domain-containing protein [Alphaproteobacteria bacterium]|nr:redoxin domain-containing protein [Alphaproteobacteria bacterium]
MKQFDERGAQLLGLSCDTVPSLKVWAQSLGGIGYPLLSDFYPHGKTCQDLGIFNAEGGYPKRSVTIVDPQGVVRASHIYPAGVLPQPDAVLAELTSLQG